MDYQKYFAVLAGVFVFWTTVVCADIVVAPEGAQVFEGSEQKYMINGFDGIKKNDRLRLVFEISSHLQNVNIQSVTAEGEAGDQIKIDKEIDSENSKSPSVDLTILKDDWSKQLVVRYQLLDDEKPNGREVVTIRHQVMLNNSPISLQVNGVHSIHVFDNDDENIVCLSKIDLIGSCYDAQIGTISILDNNGSLNTELLVKFIARTSLSVDAETQFKAEYYKIPQLVDESASSDNPFEGGGGAYKITESLKFDLNKSYKIVLSVGARTAPKQQNRLKEISPFGLLGIEREAQFNGGRGFAGLAYAKDDFWVYNEIDTTTNISTNRDYAERFILYGSLAINKSGSVMLTTYIDSNIKGDGPGEAGVALTFGGKWSALLSNLSAM